MKKNFKSLGLKVFLVGLVLMLVTPIAYAGLYYPIWKKLVIEPYHRMVYAKTLHHWVMTSGTSFARNVDTLLIFNPSPANNPGISSLMRLIIRVVQPLYILVIIGIALYLLFMSGSPKGRTRAKQTLQRVIISMIAFTLSPLLLSLLLQTSQSLTEAAFNITGVPPITEILTASFHGAWVVIAWLSMPNYAVGSNPWAYTFYFMAWFPYMLVSVRSIVLTLLEIVFPLSILLYSFNYTKGIGKGMLEQTMAWTFLQFFWVLSLVAVVLSAAPLQEAFVDNPTLGGTSISWLSGFSWIPIFGAPFTQHTMGTTDVFTLMLGVVAYAMLTALPFALIALLRGFLP